MPSPSSLKTPFLLLALIFLSASTHATPTPLNNRAPIPGSQLHCGGRPLETSDVNAAFTNLRKQSSGGKYWLQGKKSASAGSGGAQFYICNNAKSKRYFTLDQAAQDEAHGYFEECGRNSFWVMHSDNWSYGVDVNGNVECGGF